MLISDSTEQEKLTSFIWIQLNQTEAKTAQVLRQGWPKTQLGQILIIDERKLVCCLQTLMIGPNTLLVWVLEFGTPSPAIMISALSFFIYSKLL